MMTMMMMMMMVMIMIMIMIMIMMMIGEIGSGEASAFEAPLWLHR